MATNKAREAVIIDVPEDVEDNDGVSTPPGSGMQITFRNLVYRVKNKQNKKEDTEILHGLSGFFNPSQMTAVMGPRYVPIHVPDRPLPTFIMAFGYFGFAHPVSCHELYVLSACLQLPA